eukprot:GHVN01024084.1.p1 GENE.GHVN01024084.1~~GHVN01024084.1.p1  ORF type:complete len:376 (-),score=65.70 GHVN01024084.1:68-1195(-)
MSTFQNSPPKQGADASLSSSAPEWLSIGQSFRFVDENRPQTGSSAPQEARLDVSAEIVPVEAHLDYLSQYHKKIKRSKRQKPPKHDKDRGEGVDVDGERASDDHLAPHHASHKRKKKKRNRLREHAGTSSDEVTRSHPSLSRRSDKGPYRQRHCGRSGESSRSSSPHSGGPQQRDQRNKKGKLKKERHKRVALELATASTGLASTGIIYEDELGINTKSDTLPVWMRSGADAHRRKIAAWVDRLGNVDVYQYGGSQGARLAPARFNRVHYVLGATDDAARLALLSQLDADKTERQHNSNVPMAVRTADRYYSKRRWLKNRSVPPRLVQTNGGDGGCDDEVINPPEFISLIKKDEGGDGMKAKDDEVYDEVSARTA